MRPYRRRFLRGSLTLAGLGLLAGCGVLPPRPQQPAKLPRIGTLSPGPREAVAPIFIEPALDGLRELGYVEARDIGIDQRWAEEDARLADLAAELVGLD